MGRRRCKSTTPAPFHRINSAIDPSQLTGNRHRRAYRMQDTITPGAKAVLSIDALQALIVLLTRQGYAVIGPRVRDGAIVYDEIASYEDLPSGIRDRQDAGRYKLEPRDDGAFFGSRLGRNPGSASCIGPFNRFGPRKRLRTGSRSRAQGAGPRSSPSLACGPASLTPSPFRIVFSAKGRIAMKPTRRGAGMFYRRGELRPRRRELLLRFHAVWTQGRQASI